MPMPSESRTISCPNCGRTQTVPLNILVEGNTGTAVRGPGEELKSLAKKIQQALNDSRLNAANAWIDMPRCPTCGHLFRYNVQTQEAR